jgi:hypothetical protein
MTAPQDPVVQALQQVLAAQHAAVYGYPVIGVKLRSPVQVRLARQLEASHRRTRDELMAQLAARRVSSVPAEASYAAAQPLTAPADAQRWALDLEEACARAYRYLLVAPVLAVTGATGSASSGSASSGATASTASTASGGTGSVAPPNTSEQASLRRQALAGLTTATLNATEWRRLLNPSAPTTPFPGL